MEIWNYFIYIAILCVLLWVTGAIAAWKRKESLAIGMTLGGIIVLALYIALLWGVLDRPPLRTMGETRLWYSMLLPTAGLIVYLRWHYKWILSFSAIMSIVFICINLFKPEIHTKELMPALQSVWFAPHVIVYMMAYAMLGAAFLMAVYLLIMDKRIRRSDERTRIMSMTDNMVDVGYAFLTLGMLMGALWAKEAWGTYWSWDPKETWAAITWLSYLLYIHYRLYHPSKVKPAMWMLIISFCLLQMCWWGINYLPAAQGASVHTYGMK